VAASATTSSPAVAATTRSRAAAGDDILTGGLGKDRFVFGGVDTGRDQITDFDSLKDVIDISAPFWGMTGDARAYIAVRLDTNYSTPVPTLDSVLVVTRPDAANRKSFCATSSSAAPSSSVSSPKAMIRMGGLSIPTTVQLALAPGSSGAPLGESINESFAITVTRSGAGTSAALDVPLGFFEQALGGRFVIDGATTNQGKRSVIRFARGETSKTLTVRPIPDLETTGVTNVEVAVLPHFRYAVSGAGVSQTIGDNPMVWLEVIAESAVANPAQPARVRLHRSGGTAQNLTVDLALGGTAENGVHIESLANTLTIPAGQSSRELTITARAAGLADGPKVVLVRLASREHYLMGNPHEALIFVGNTAAETHDAGFDRWLQAATNGAMSNHVDLQRMAPGRMGDYVQAYAFGLANVDEPGKHGISLRIVAGRPELKAPGQFKAADLRWGVQSSAGLGGWENAGAGFTQVPDPAGLKLVGQPLDPTERSKFYRLNMTLDPGQLAGDTIKAITGSADYGIGGNGNWNADPATGHLASTAAARAKPTASSPTSAARRRSISKWKSPARTERTRSCSTSTASRKPPRTAGPSGSSNPSTTGNPISSCGNSPAVPARRSFAIWPGEAEKRDQPPMNADVRWINEGFPCKVQG
jgi:hypothetical protein